MVIIGLLQDGAGTFACPYPGGVGREHYKKVNK